MITGLTISTETLPPHHVWHVRTHFEAGDGRDPLQVFPHEAQQLGSIPFSLYWGSLYSLSASDTVDWWEAQALGLVQHEKGNQE